jgi:hypothetical protein
MLQIPFPSMPTVGVFCTGKIHGGQDHAFLSRDGLANYSTLQFILVQAPP